MANKRTLTIEFLGKDKSGSKVFGDIEAKSDSLGSKLADFGKKAAIGLGVVGVAAGAMALDFVHAAEESAQVTRQTEAVIKSMGNVAGISAQGIADLSEQLSLKTGIDDEVIQSGENVLLTFANVRNEVGKGNDVFTRATTVANDMSVALGQDMQSSVTQIGKALNDPIAGITALTRVGVQFTDQQKDQIKTLVESGDSLGAQKIILGELERQFGGSAEAQATASQKMAVAWDNLKEELGAKLLPVFNAVSDWIIETGIPAIEDLSDWVKTEVVPVLKDWGRWLGDHVLPVLQDLGDWIVNTAVPALQDFARWLGENKDVLAAVAIGAGAVILGVLVPAFIAWAVAAGAAAIATLLAAAPFILIGAAIAAFAFLVIHNWDTIREATIVVFNAVKGAIETAFNWVRDNWPLLLGIITGPIGMAVYLVTHYWESIKAGFTAVKDWIGARITDIVGFFTGLPGRLASAAGNLWGFISSGFKSAINAVISMWNGLRIPGISIHQSLPGPIPDINFSAGPWDLPNIPLLAQGGVVPQTPGGVLALLGEGRHDEAVVPLDGRHGMGSTTIVNVNVAGSVLTERQLIDTLNEAMARGARLNVNGRYL
jgi:hypothetical protein